MTLEEFVETLTVQEWSPHAAAVVAFLEPHRESIESFTIGLDMTAPETRILVLNMWARLEEGDPSLHRKLIEAAGGGTRT